MDDAAQEAEVLPGLLPQERPVGPEGEGARLDVYAPTCFPQLPSRASALKASRRGRILLDGRAAEGSRRLKAGQRLTLLPSQSPPPPPYKRALKIIYADAHIAVVYKPAGLPVSGNKHRTVEHALPVNIPPCTEVDALPAPRPVHRLDVRTQGLLLVARSARGMVGLGRAFEGRQVHKTYAAVVLGRLEGEGEVNQPVGGRSAHSWYAATRQARSLHTDWLTLVSLKPTTGRTHQLRQHLASLGHPILGDELYTQTGPVLKGSGLYLAAIGLELHHPVSGEALTFNVEIPAKFETTLARETRRWHRLHGDA